jgi:pimeloyl-ACP methyl ester carboxylesterase
MLFLLVIPACTKSSDKAVQPPTPTRTPTAAVPSSAPTPARSGAGVGPIAFSDCSGQFQRSVGTARAKKLQFFCGKVTVPLDHRKPDGSKLQLFVLKVHASAQQAAQRIGSLVINPGGPGVSGVLYAAQLAGTLDPAVLARFDLVGFDPRGVGLSAPIECMTDKQKDQQTAQDVDVRIPTGRAVAKARADAIARGCSAKYGSRLAHMNTEETARDLDLLRQGLGDAKLSYLGFSYGTRLGATYAHLFPTRLRVAALDGAESPSADEVSTDEAQVQGFEEAFDQFAADCTSRPACAVLGNPRTAAATLIARANRSPIASGKHGETRLASGGVITVGIAYALYDRALWPALGAGLVAARGGDSARMFALADSYSGRNPETGHYSNELDAFLTVTCNDSTTKLSDAQVGAAATRWTARYPLFGRNSAQALYSCHAWPGSGHPVPSPTAAGAPPILVVGTAHDPATPYSGATALARALGTGSVLTWQGEGHTAYGKTGCVTSKVDSYLITGALPAGRSCPAS